MNTPVVKKLPEVDIDREGWWAIRHIDGWWLGTERGTLCYEDFDMARVALTIRWQMDGGGRMNYQAKKYPGPTTPGGEIQTKKTAEQAIIDYENTIPKNDIPLVSVAGFEPTTS